MVAGVAHEINNPVTFIHGNIDCLGEYSQNLIRIVEFYERHYQLPQQETARLHEEFEFDFVCEDLPKVLLSMKVGSARIRQIVSSLRNFSRLDEADLKSVDLHDGINNTVMILGHRLKAQPDRAEIKIACEYGNIPPVECFAGPLNQVFMNILSNAIDALDEKARTEESLESTQAGFRGRIVVRTETIAGGDERDWVRVSISDNGPGVPAEIYDRIFEPFFTTKGVGKGTGLGMSISYKIVTERHQGRLEYATSAEGGALFTIDIPATQAALTGVAA